MCSFELKRLLMSANHEIIFKSAQKLNLLKYAHNKSGPVASLPTLATTPFRLSFGMVLRNLGFPRIFD